MSIDGEPREQLGLLYALWATRDALYAQRSLPLTAEEVSAVVANRVKEARQLATKQDRAKAGFKAIGWYPPEHGQGAL